MEKRNLQDLLVYLVLIGLGTLAFVLSCRATDFVGDAYYFELARSIAKGAGYMFDFRPQTMVPPGFPLLLALMTMIVGSSYAVLVRSMAVFSTLALIATYEVLRSEEGRWVAAATCLLLGSSPEVFQFNEACLLRHAVFLHQHDSHLVTDTARLRHGTNLAADDVVVAFGCTDDCLGAYAFDRDCTGRWNSGVDRGFVIP